MLLLPAARELHEDRRGADAAPKGALEHRRACAIRRGVDALLLALVQGLLHRVPLGRGIATEETLQAGYGLLLQGAQAAAGPIRRAIGGHVAAAPGISAQGAAIPAGRVATPREGLARRADAAAAAGRRARRVNLPPIGLKLRLPLGRGIAARLVHDRPPLPFLLPGEGLGPNIRSRRPPFLHPVGRVAHGREFRGRLLRCSPVGISGSLQLILRGADRRDRPAQAPPAPSGRGIHAAERIPAAAGVEVGPGIGGDLRLVRVSPSPCRRRRCSSCRPPCR
jgi:hypothetical protein